MEQVTMNRDTIVLRLELIAAKAKQLAEDVKHGRLWEGQLFAGLQEINEQLGQVQGEARTDR